VVWGGGGGGGSGSGVGFGVVVGGGGGGGGGGLGGGGVGRGRGRGRRVSFFFSSSSFRSTDVEREPSLWGDATPFVPPPEFLCRQCNFHPILSQFEFDGTTREREC